MQSVHVRATTLIDYTSKVRRHIIKELGQMRMADVTLDDIQLALVPVSEKSASVYKSVVILYKSIFRAAKESKIIDNNPTIYLTAKGGGVPQKDKAALTDEQAARLLDAIQGLPPYVFVMLGLYAGLRREEILALKWDSVYLDTLNFDVTPHLLRHTYITNLLYAGVDPKTVQYLAGHENSKTTMDIYARVKYNKPEELFEVVNDALNQENFDEKSLISMVKE